MMMWHTQDPFFLPITTPQGSIRFPTPAARFKCVLLTTPTTSFVLSSEMTLSHYHDTLWNFLRVSVILHHILPPEMLAVWRLLSCHSFEFRFKGPKDCFVSSSPSLDRKGPIASPRLRRGSTPVIIWEGSFAYSIVL